jgi:hypothetical protein
MIGDLPINFDFSVNSKALDEGKISLIKNIYSAR